MDYLYILIADVLLGAIFVLNKKYQQHAGSGLKAGIVSNLMLGSLGLIISFAALGFKPEFTLFSLLIATLSTACGVIYTVIGLKILSGGKVSVYAMFLMTGGMLIPFLYGVIFLKESINALKIIGLVLIIFSIVVTNFDKQKPSKKQLIMSVAVFFLNGFLGVCSKIHQTTVKFDTVSTEGYVFLGNIAKVTLSLIVLAVIVISAKQKERSALPDATVTDKNKDAAATPIIKRLIPYALLLAIAVFDFISYYCQLEGSVTIPASVLFPLVSGGSIVMTAAVGMLILREKPTKSAVIGMLLCIGGMCAFI